MSRLAHIMSVSMPSLTVALFLLTKKWNSSCLGELCKRKVSRKQLTYPTGEVGNIDSTHIVPYWSVGLGEGTGLLEVNNLDERPLVLSWSFLSLLFGGLFRPKIEDLNKVPGIYIYTLTSTKL